MRIEGVRIREVLNKVPHFGEILLGAAVERRRLLLETGAVGLKVVGPGKCRDTMLVREFLFKNFVPFIWHDSVSEEGQRLMTSWGMPTRSPVIEFGNGRRLINPSLREVALTAGVWRDCPTDVVDLVIVGAGPAGIAAAVYAASEGVSTVVLDRLGPGGQAGASSRIENFIGFPNGLSGNELATRGVLQMLKFGARMVAPVVVNRIDSAEGPDGFHTLHLDCGTQLRTRTILAATGVSWRQLGVEGSERFESAGVHHAAPAWKPGFMTIKMSPSWEQETPPARQRCFSRNVAGLAPYTCWFAGVWVRTCPITLSVAFSQLQTFWCTKVWKSRVFMVSADWIASLFGPSIRTAVNR
jgi:thioredoxin reductase (NADPH)